MTLPTEKPTDSLPLDDSQQQRILDAVFRGPVTELIAEVVKRSLAPRKRSEDEAEYAKKTQGRLKAIKFEIPLDDQTPKADFRCRPTWDDRRRLATIGNTASIGTSRALHHAVRVGHHLFRTVMMEIMATSEQTGEPIRELLAVVGTGSGIRPVVGTEQQQAGEKPPLGAATPTVVAPEVHHAAIAAQSFPGLDSETALAAESPDLSSTALSIPPTSMPKRSATSSTREGLTDERLDELETRMARLQETMDVLIAAIDELRTDLVHTLRNLPDQLPPPVHIHSLPLDPTAPDFGERINVIPQEVMARLREEAARGGGEPAVATAAEGDPSPAPTVDGAAGNGHRPQTRQGKLFG